MFPDAEACESMSLKSAAVLSVFGERLPEPRRRRSERGEALSEYLEWIWNAESAVRAWGERLSVWRGPSLFRVAPRSVRGGCRSADEAARSAFGATRCLRRGCRA